MKRILIMGFLILTLLALPICNACGESVTSGGVLRSLQTWAFTGSLGVPERSQGATQTAMRIALEPLLTYDIEGNFYPVLAEDWEWSEDYTSITFNLREGVIFHDGTDFNADAVKWNMDRRIAAGTSGANTISEVVVVDDYTVRFDLVGYNTFFLPRMAGYLGYMTSPTAVETNGEDWADLNPVGTGPFKFKAFEVDNYLEFERFDDYWGEPAYLDGVKFVYISDAVTAQIAFEAGEGEMLYIQGSGSDYADDLLGKGFNALWEYTRSGKALWFDTAHEDSPFYSVKVRMAVEYAINKEYICETLGDGYWDPIYQNGAWGVISEDFEGRQYDPDMARQLLAEAAAEGAFEPNDLGGFDCTFYCFTTLGGDYMEAIQSDLLAVGIDAQIEYLTAARWLEFELGSDCFYNSIMSSVLLDAIYALDYAEGIYVNWPSQIGHYSEDCVARPEALDALSAAFFATDDLGEQREIASQIEAIIYEDCSMVPLWQNPDCHFMVPELHDMKIWGWGPPDYSKAWLESD